MREHRQREVAVDARVAVTGEVLGAGGDAFRLEPGEERTRVSCDELRRAAETAVADHGVGRVRVDVDDRREREIDAQVGELAAERVCHRGGEGEIIVLAEPAHRRPRCPPVAQTLHAATFLVDRDDERQLGGSRGVQSTQERARLLGALEVPPEQHDAADASRGDLRAQRSGELRALEAAEQQLARRECVAGAGRHGAGSGTRGKRRSNSAALPRKTFRSTGRWMPSIRPSWENCQNSQSP